jgi:peptidoglycan/xylan/chitin deacetylase (PgdA/CDA1 family)
MTIHLHDKQPDQIPAATLDDALQMLRDRGHEIAPEGDDWPHIIQVVLSSLTPAEQEQYRA